MKSEPARASLRELAILISEIHQTATGREITILEAGTYFREPQLLFDLLKRAGIQRNGIAIEQRTEAPHTHLRSEVRDGI